MVKPLYVWGGGGSMTGIIYMYTCRTTGMQYIGQTRTTLEKRAGHHMSKYTSYDSKFARAILKYGYENFSGTVLHSDIPIELLNDYESMYIELYDTFNSGYNTTTGGGQSFEFTQEHKDKISGENNHMYGKTRDDITRAKISKSLTGRFKGELSPHYGRKASAETRKKQSMIRKGMFAGGKHPKAKPCEYDDIQFGSMKEAYEYAKSVGYRHSYPVFRDMLMGIEKDKGSYWRGRHLDDEHKKKISESRKGISIPNNGLAKKCWYDNQEFDSYAKAYKYATEHGFRRSKNVFIRLIKENKI